MANAISSLETRKKVIENCWDYLLGNFYKLTETNKIKVSLAICTKNIPQELIGDLKGQETKVVIIKEILGDQDSQGRLSRSISIIKE